MERETGFEPATSSLGSWHSTTELLPLGTCSNHTKHVVFPQLYLRSRDEYLVFNVADRRTLTDSGSCSSPSIRFSRISAARNPISYAGCTIVVTAGRNKSSTVSSSKVMNPLSSVVFWPRY